MGTVTDIKSRRRASAPKTKTIKTKAVKAKGPKRLTENQRNLMALDRADHIMAVLGLDEVDTEAHEEVQEFLLELYDADLQTGKDSGGA